MSLKKFFKNYFTKDDDGGIQELEEQERSDIMIMKPEPSPKAIKKSWIYGVSGRSRNIRTDR